MYVGGRVVYQIKHSNIFSNDQKLCATCDVCGAFDCKVVIP